MGRGALDRRTPRCNLATHLCSWWAVCELLASPPSWRLAFPPFLVYATWPALRRNPYAALPRHRFGAPFMIKPNLLIATLVLVTPTLATAENKPKVSSVAEFTDCIDTGWGPEACLTALKAFVKKNPGLRFAAGKAVRVAVNHEAALPYFETAMAGKFDRKLCADEDLRLVVIGNLSRPEGKQTVAARKLLGGVCWTDLAGPIKKEIATAPGGYLADNACPVMEQKKDPCTHAPAAAAPATTATRKWVDADPTKLAVDDVAKVYTGGEGRRITVARVKGDATAVLIKFEGVRGPWNHKVILHREQDSGNGFDYWTRVDGDDWVSLVARKGWGGGDLGYELHPRGDNGPYHLSYDADASRAAKPAALLTDLKKR